MRTFICLMLVGFCMAIILMFVSWVPNTDSFDGTSRANHDMSLRILLISDIHGQMKDLAKLLRREGKQQYDLVIISGDIASFDHTAADVDQSEADAQLVWRQLREQLERLRRDGGPAVMYVPGNHDPLRYYTDDAALGEATLVHNRMVSLADNLVVVGFGGSVPAIFQSNSSLSWPGFPFSDQEMGKSARSLIQEIPPHHQALLVTHCGPAGVSTTIDNYNVDQVTLSGSQALTRLLKHSSSQATLVAHVHGHTHVGYGAAHIGPVAVVNPGALKWSRYGVLELLASGRDGELVWEVGEMNFLMM